MVFIDSSFAQSRHLSSVNQFYFVLKCFLIYILLLAVSKIDIFLSTFLSPKIGVFLVVIYSALPGIDAFVVVSVTTV